MGIKNGYGVIIQIDEQNNLGIKPIGDTDPSEIRNIISSANSMIIEQRIDSLEVVVKRLHELVNTLFLSLTDGSDDDDDDETS